SCVNWVCNGFCNNAGLEKNWLERFCPTTCCFLFTTTVAPPTTTTKTPDVENPNCAKWAADPAKAFCASDTITPQQKLASCSVTCSFEISSTSDCAIYTVANNVLIRQTTVQR
ncbi:hypothetical protein PENTCL1PPCAC_29036, partial [Pristionchus entomophagus]